LADHASPSRTLREVIDARRAARHALAKYADRNPRLFGFNATPWENSLQADVATRGETRSANAGRTVDQEMTRNAWVVGGCCMDL